MQPLHHHINDTISSAKCAKQGKSVDLSFMNIQYIITDIRGERRGILQNVTGFCPGAQVTAILGSSGAGKTTLLNILSCRIKQISKVILKGQIMANNFEYNAEIFSSFAAYVMQNDILFETFTPNEAFEFVANLKFHSQEAKNHNVELAIKTMKLQNCQNTLIGGPSFKGISGGERKRTSIGFELVTNPSCILLDEPTSGLDSFTALEIINQLRKLAHNEEKTIVFTIHQPSSDIFLLFDRIMLLVQGKFIYQGKRADLVNYFNGIGFECPSLSNPMDYMMSIMHSNEENIRNFAIFFKQYDDKEINKWIFQKSFNYQAKIRNAIFMGLLVGGSFYGIGNNNGSYSNYAGVAGCVFLLVMNLTMGSLFPVVLQFSTERDVFLREENSRLYTTFSYFIGKSFVEIPFSLIAPIVQEMILYWMVDFNSNNAAVVMTHLFIAILISLNGNSLGLMGGCAFNDLKVATSMVPMLLLPLTVFSGFLANKRQFYVWIGWLQYVSPLKYSFEALATNEFVGRNYQFGDPLEVLGFDVGMWQSVGVLIAFVVLIRILAFVFLYMLRSKQQ